MGHIGYAAYCYHTFCYQHPRVRHRTNKMQGTPPAAPHNFLVVTVGNVSLRLSRLSDIVMFVRLPLLFIQCVTTEPSSCGCLDCSRTRMVRRCKTRLLLPLSFAHFILLIFSRARCAESMKRLATQLITTRLRIRGYYGSDFSWLRRFFMGFIELCRNRWRPQEVFDILSIVSQHSS